MTAHTTFEGPFPNKFKKFATMTYSISIYIQSAEHYKKMINSKDGFKTVDGLALLLQSGGIDDASTHGAVRSTDFKNDFYIDDVQLNSLISGTATGSPNNTYELNFKVTEPMGLTFLESLNNAIQTYNKALTGSDKKINFVSQTYLMVVRFYGYDASGNQVKGDEFQTSDPSASVEKFIPFLFTGITFRMDASQVEYACTAVAPATQIATDRVHGIIPKNTGVEGVNLSDILSDGTSSLKVALNQHQAGLEEERLYKQADTYNFEFHGEGLKKAVMKLDGAINVNQSGNTVLTQGETFTKSKIKSETKLMATTAGISIIKFIDIAIRSSSFIHDQFDVSTDTNDVSKATFKNNQNKDKPLNWFKIVPRIEIKDFDTARNDFAYDITFVISEYPVPSLGTISAIFSSKGCFNIHKEYDFWFTGNNTEILDFTQEYNFLYYTAFGGAQPSKSSQINFANVDAADSTLRNYNQNTPSGTMQNGDDSKNQQSANAASILYSPADQANVVVDIVGDPDWLTQSELFYGPNENRADAPIMPDGSINTTGAEVFFSISFNTVVDYSLNTGLADVTQKNIGQLNDKGGTSEYKLVYRANTITTQLNAGKFVQKLEGTIVFVPGNCPMTNRTNESDQSVDTTIDTTPGDDSGAQRDNTGNDGSTGANVQGKDLIDIKSTVNPTAKLIKSFKNEARQVLGRGERPGTVPTEITAAEQKAIDDRAKLHALKGKIRANNRGNRGNNGNNL